MMPNDSLSKVLYIDLTKKKFETRDRKDLFEKYLGGTGVATELLLEECPEGLDPFTSRCTHYFCCRSINRSFSTSIENMCYV